MEWGAAFTVFYFCVLMPLWFWLMASIKEDKKK